MTRANREWLGPVRPLQPREDVQAAALRAELAESAADAGLARLAGWLRGESQAAGFLVAAAELLPYLADTFRRHPQLLEDLFTRPLGDCLDAIHGEIEEFARVADLAEGQFMDALRNCKRRAHALIALDDVARAVGPQETVLRLSRLAECCIGAAIRYVLIQAHRGGKLLLPDPDEPERGSGWIILAMGKLGARELNYSSDIDLVVFFDPAAPAIPDKGEATDLFVRLTRQFVRILNERTGSGYVFRTDLRLRPDPGSTPFAIPVPAALIYYESRGQNWERAAMIKARPVAGDREAGEAFLRELQPYVWRKYLDYATIADIHAIKRQIHLHKGHGRIAVRGHNLKLGRGGIREIEFFVQTQQLIAGGRFPELRGRETAAMLAMLADRGWITAEAREALTGAYWFLRDVENAVQMVNDEQTHSLPESEEDLARIAFMRGIEGHEALSDRLRETFLTVERHYGALFEGGEEEGPAGNLILVGDEDDPDTLQTLSAMGFERPADMCRILRSWHFGRYRATQPSDARKRLTQLIPQLLQAFGRTGRADEALLRFDEFLAGLPAGIQLFSLLQSNPPLLDLIVTIMATAPKLARTVTRRPHVFDGLLDPALISELPDRNYLRQRLHAFLAGAQSYEETLDRLRIFAAEQRFLIGIRLLTGVIDAGRAGLAFSDLADLAIGATLEAVQENFAGRHGRIAGGRLAILAMGKLGSRELTASSDIDMILLYDHDDDASVSDGGKPLDPVVYFSRLTQRLIAAVSAPTAEGVLYEIDLRLRPSGNKGPVATHIDAFRKYQREQAWTWEHMALTRARAIAGDEGLMSEAMAEIDAILAMERDHERVRRDAAQMRDLIAEEKPPASNWDIKLIAGGTIDLEFIAQTAVLCGAIRNRGRETGTGRILERISPDVLSPQAREELIAAHHLYTTVTQIVRLCLEGEIDPGDIPPGLVDLLLRNADFPGLAVMEAQIEETSRHVQNWFDMLLREGRERGDGTPPAVPPASGVDLQDGVDP